MAANLFRIGASRSVEYIFSNLYEGREKNQNGENFPMINLVPMWYH